LVTVIGAGGVGKSRLALRVASNVRRAFPDGVWMVELAAISGPGLVAETIGGDLRVPDFSGREPVEALSAFFADRELLLILDNCEHLHDEIAPLAAGLLARAPHVRVLATSREVLGLPGESVYRLQPLPVPDEGVPSLDAVTCPAVLLFADRAAAAMNGFEVTDANGAAVAELCRRLDGIPLAIELAAVHVRALSPAQILEHLDDQFRLLAARAVAVHPRHRSLHAAAEWSYDLCSKPERLVWSRLSVFAGGFGLTTAEAVCVGDGLTLTEVVEAIGDLVDKSVLVSEAHPEGMRYRMLAMIREFGLQQLRDAAEAGDDHAVPETELRRRHLWSYVALAEEFDQNWFGPRQAEWLVRLHAELPNIRSALAWSLNSPDQTRTGLCLAAELCFFWRVTAMREGQGWLTRLLSVEPEPTRERGRALSALAWLVGAREGRAGVDIAREAMEIAERFDPERLPRAIVHFGTLSRRQGEPGNVDLLGRAVLLSRDLTADAETAYAVFTEGWALGLSSDVIGAASRFRECIGICDTAGEYWWRGVVQLRWALLAWLHDDREVMAETAVGSLRSARLVPDLLTCADAVNIIATLEVGADDRRAAYLLGAADRHWRDAGGSIVHSPPWAALLAERTATCRATLGDDTFLVEYGRGKEHALEEAIAEALGEQPTSTVEASRAREGFGLTRREREVGALIAEGLTNKEIAARLVISTRTAEAHVQHMLTKMGFTNRSQLAAWYARQLES
jgi:predicted ATPase/DNA-binding CsgD family transcriptional regulator